MEKAFKEEIEELDFQEPFDSENLNEDGGDEEGLVVFEKKEKESDVFHTGCMGGGRTIYDIFFQELRKIPMATFEKQTEMAIQYEEKRKKIAKMEIQLRNRQYVIDKLESEIGNQSKKRAAVSLANLEKLKERKEKIVKELEKVKNSAKKIRKELSEGSLPLVQGVAKKYKKRGLTYPELISEGYIGLSSAIEKFELAKSNGAQFRTHAVWWVKQSISKALMEKVLEKRIPVNMWDTIRKANEIIAESKRGIDDEDLTAKEIAEAICKSEKATVAALKANSERMVSMSLPIGDEDGADSELIDVLVNENVRMPEEEVIENDMKVKVRKVLSLLPENEAKILRQRFGIDTVHPQTLKEIGKDFCLTRERIRQIEFKAKNTIQNRHSEEDLTVKTINILR